MTRLRCFDAAQQGCPRCRLHGKARKNLIAPPGSADQNSQHPCSGSPIHTAMFDSNLPCPALAEAQLRAINQRFVNACVIPDSAFMEALVADDFLMIDRRGEWVDRATCIRQMAQAPGIDGASYEDLRVRLFGPVALLHGVFRAFKGTQVTRVRYTDVYQWDGRAWRLVSGENTTMGPTVPVPLQTGTEPVHAPWQGLDPVGADLEVLHEINANYVRSFRECDVGWYAAHMAPDYVAAQSDGSLHDRALALARFAEPTFATQMKSFPVDDVRIRLFGDVALIHAENAYELKDGRKGAARYTDIWVRRSNGWMCLAAHITPFKSPA
jgi:ketosteroid isomerase-like protein